MSDAEICLNIEIWSTISDYRIFVTVSEHNNNVDVDIDME